MNLDVVKNVIIYIVALLFNIILGYMFVTQMDIPTAFWAVYSAVNAPLGISLVYNGVKAIKK